MKHQFFGAVSHLPFLHVFYLGSPERRSHQYLSAGTSPRSRHIIHWKFSELSRWRNLGSWGLGELWILVSTPCENLGGFQICWDSASLKLSVGNPEKMGELVGGILSCLVFSGRFSGAVGFPNPKSQARKDKWHLGKSAWKTIPIWANNNNKNTISIE